MMTSRELPVYEWDRLPEACELAKVAGMLPDSARIVVVEQDGQIIGAWSLMMVAHVEGVWIHPEHRGLGAVARGLLRAMRSALRGWGVSAALTGGDEQIVTLLKKLGAEAVPFPFYVWHARKDRILSEEISCLPPSPSH